MINSMTGYGRGEAAAKGVRVTVELRAVNSRFLEVSARLPQSLSLRESEVKERIRKKISRGKINMLVSVEREADGAVPLRVNVSAAKSYYKLLNQLRRTLKVKETVKLEHLLQFSEILEAQELESPDETEWEIALEATDRAMEALQTMRRRREGNWSGTSAPGSHFSMTGWGRSNDYRQNRFRRSVFAFVSAWHSSSERLRSMRVVWKWSSRSLPTGWM